MIHPIAKRMAILVGIIAVVAAIVGMFVVDNKSAYVLGVAFGALVGLFKLGIITRSVDKKMDMDPKRVQMYAVGNFFSRYLLTGVALYMTVVFPVLGLGGTVVGLLTLQASGYLVNFFYKPDKPVKPAEGI